MKYTLDIKPIDTLFFRDGFPFNAGEPSRRESFFPPPSGACYGLGRAFLLELFCSRLTDYISKGCTGCDDSQCEVHDIVGDPSKRDGSLSIKGPFVMRKGERLFVMPRDIVRLSSGTTTEQLTGAAVSSDPVTSDLGCMYLPFLGESARAFSESNECFITEGALSRYLRAGYFQKDDVIPLLEGSREDVSNAIIMQEPRTGVALEKDRRASMRGHLYSAVHIRLHSECSLSLQLEYDGGPDLRDKRAVLRFGGESKQVMLKAKASDLTLKGVEADELSKTGRVRVVLLQDADFGGSWLPPGFAPSMEGKCLEWHGSFEGVGMTLVSACVGRPVHVGGWDESRGLPREMRSLVPAGSVYYLRIEPNDASEAIARLHDAKIGFQTKFGYGHIAVGVWKYE